MFCWQHLHRTQRLHHSRLHLHIRPNRLQGRQGKRGQYALPSRNDNTLDPRLEDCLHHSHHQKLHFRDSLETEDIINTDMFYVKHGTDDVTLLTALVASLRLRLHCAVT